MAIAAVMVWGTGTANAELKVCSGSGKLTALAGVPRATWQVSGNGDCFGPGQPRQLSFTGKGTSKGLGLCTGGLLVRNLRLSVLVTQRFTVSGRVTKEYEIWSSPYTMFPLATPFLVDEGHQLAGAGIAIHHIHLMCGNAGTEPSAVFEWTTLR
jgi:hypothetical protein